MREIKFRGYCSEFNQWFYGVGIWHKYGGDRIVYDVTDDPNCEYKYMLDSYEIEKDSVGQYTGLKDYKGREIYEGDIVEFSLDPYRSIKGSIKFDYGSFYLETNDEIYGDILFANINFDLVGVIGNIYENPELLKITKDNK